MQDEKMADCFTADVCIILQAISEAACHLHVLEVQVKAQLIGTRNEMMKGSLSWRLILSHIRIWDWKVSMFCLSLSSYMATNLLSPDGY